MLDAHRMRAVGRRVCVHPARCGRALHTGSVDTGDYAGHPADHGADGAAHLPRERVADMALSLGRRRFQNVSGRSRPARFVNVVVERQHWTVRTNRYQTLCARPMQQSPPLHVAPQDHVELLQGCGPGATARSLVTGTVDGVTSCWGHSIGACPSGLRLLEATPPAV